MIDRAEQIRNKRRNKGSTLVELVVCFALLGIFMSASAVVISNVANIYFDAKGETYARQVSDIVMRKITAEIEGARITADDASTHPAIYRTEEDADAEYRSGYKIDLYDRTDTHIQMYEENGLLKIKYFPINMDLEVGEDGYEDRYEQTIWSFDESVYQGFEIEELRFVPANQGITPGEINENEVSQAAGISTVDYDASEEDPDYPGNVIGVYLTLKSPLYGEFYYYKYVRMYNLDDNAARNYKVRLLTEERD
ncbi:MAG: prepilin-type N-terminal cleavage/methylation domain-containing protein [Lachnospiraceae bacterium]|nr:prepilin-type N-terminal cleavage/methylation domain-containing protein [Lachnospiraceae bacterium]